MPKTSETINQDLEDLLTSRGYEVTSLDSSGKEVPVSSAADLLQFHFHRDGKDYGTVTATIDGLQKLTIYYDDEIADSGGINEAHDEQGVGDTSWLGLLKQLKKFAQQHQLGFVLKDTDRLRNDMKRRVHAKKLEESKAKKMNNKQKVAEGLDMEEARERLESLRRDLKAVTGNYPGDDRNRSILRRQILDLKEKIKASGGKKQGVAEGWKEKVAGGVLGAAALGGIGAGIAYSPMAYVNGQQIQMAMPTSIPDNAKLVTADDGRKIYVWKSNSIKGRSVWHYRPAEQVKEQGVTEDQRLDPSCWKGYKKQGTKMKGDTRVNNCVPVKESAIMKGLKS